MNQQIENLVEDIERAQDALAATYTGAVNDRWYKEDMEPDYRADDQMIQDWQAARYMIEPD